MGTAATLSEKVTQVLVTGGGGFVGKALVKRMVAHGINIRVLGRNSYPDLARMGVECVVGDISCLEDVRRAAEGVDLLFHVAARAGIWGPWRDYFAPNVLGTENVLTVCFEQGIRFLVHTSTPSVVFAGEDIEGQTAAGLDHAKKFLCHYARSKSMAEKRVLSSASASFFTCAIRPHLVWGPGDPHLLPRMVEAGRQGRLKQVGNGRNLVDIAYIDNVVEAHLCAARALLEENMTVNGKAYFIGQQQPVVLWQWLNELFAALDIPTVRQQVSFKTAYRAGALLEALYGLVRIVGVDKEPPMTRFVAEQLAKSHYFSHDAAREELGYKELITTDEGFRRSIQWLKDCC